MEKYNYNTISTEVDNFCNYIEKQKPLEDKERTTEVLHYLCTKKRKSEDENGLIVKISLSMLDLEIKSFANKKEGLTFKEATEIAPALLGLSYLASK